MTIQTIDKLSDILDCSRMSVKNFVREGMPSVKTGESKNAKREFDIVEVALWIKEHKTGDTISGKHFKRVANKLLAKYRI